MNLQQIRWPVVLLVLGVTLAGLFGAGYVLKSQTVDQPVRELLAGTPQLESYRVEQRNGEMEITVRFTGAVDLKETYAGLDEELRAILKGAPYRLRVEDERTPALRRAAERIDLYVAEGVATGAFAAMADRIEAEAEAAGAEARVAIDSARVYVTLTAPDGYLYSVTERTDAGRGDGGDAR